MAESVQCKICGQPATVHLTQIVDNAVHKVDLCENCAKKTGVSDPEGFSLADLLTTHLLSDSPAEELSIDLKCPTCGFTPADFKKMGRLGCPDCYDAFKPLLEHVLSTMHKATTHCGKVPTRSLDRITRQRRLAELEQNLHKAVSNEHYEDAARYRDEIAKLKASPPSNSPSAPTA